MSPTRDTIAYLNHLLAMVAYATQGSDMHQNLAQSSSDHGSPIPILAALPLHRDAGRIADLNPYRARTGPIGAVDFLRDDSLRAKPASVLKNSWAIRGDVFIEQDASLGIDQSGEVYKRDPGLEVRRAKLDGGDVYEITFWQQFKTYATVQKETPTAV
jgi:hypothetical protein